MFVFARVLAPPAGDGYADPARRLEGKRVQAAGFKALTEEQKTNLVYRLSLNLTKPDFRTEIIF